MVGEADGRMVGWEPTRVARRGGRWGAWALALAGVVAGAGARAAAQDAAEPTGDAYDGLPGLVETRVAETRPRHLAVSVAAGYGFTEALASDDGSHHRVPMVVSAAGYVMPQLALSLRIDGRYDVHPDDGYGSDAGGVLSSQLGVRGVGQLGDRFSLGGQLTAHLVGTDGASAAVDALSFDATAFAAYRPLDGLTLALDVGYLLDRSGGAYDPNAPVRRGDYVAWGVSDYDALLLRAGAGYRTGKVELVADVASRVLVGSGAPTGLSSVHANAGVRYHLNRRFQLAASAQVEVGRRPSVGVDPSPTTPFVPQDALVTIDPRFVVQVGFRYAWEPGAEQDRAPEAPEPEPVPATRVVEGRVVDAGGQPLADVTVRLRVGDDVLEQRTDIDGAYRFDAVPPGDGTAQVTSEGFADLEVPLTAVGLPRQIQLAAAHPGGQLRGLLREFDGSPVQGIVLVRPGGVEVTADAEGRFELDLAPGEYQVQIRAPGFRRQVRNLTVREGEVTILNVDLHPR